MKPVLRSLRFRLMVYAVVVVVAALIITGAGVAKLFERHARRQIDAELDVHLAQIVGALRFAQDGTASLAHQPADPRFNKIYGGLFWQVSDVSGQALLRSRSLWDSELRLPAESLVPGELYIREIPGPAETTVLVHEKLVTFPTPQGAMPLRVSVAIDVAAMKDLVSGFTRDMIPALILLGFALLVGFAVQVSAGLRPMVALREQIAAIREGRQRRLSGPVPQEIAPLAAEMNELLANQEQDMVRARDRAADMAHGLKTPLTALATDVRRLREKGELEIADDIEDLANRMRRHLERELARARLRHGRAALRTEAAPVIHGIVRTLRRTPRGQELTFDESVPDDFRLPVDQDDLAEVLGNLIENASRHAKSTVRVAAGERAGEYTICVEDDGPGIPPEKLAALTARGNRLDTSGGSAGLGLAIVSDILAAYGGKIDFGTSPLGGLRATCCIPAASLV